MTTRSLTAASVALLTALAATTASAQERVQWKMQSAFPSNLSHLGTSGKRLENMVDRVSGGNFELKFFEPGALVPALECFDAASIGSVDAYWTTAGYHTGKYPALAFFTAVPLGPDFGEYFAWMMFGGGKELQNDIYTRHNLYSLDCNMIGPETSGWFKERVESLEDLKGLKMRFFGLGAQVMQKLGVSTQLLAGADIYPALERGVIDATEFSMPNMDIDLEFYQVAKYNHYPGWHQQSSVGELLMHKEAWDALDDQNKAILEAACGWNICVNYAETEAMNPVAMNKMLEEYGVTNVRWTDEELAASEQAWRDVLEEQSAQDADFARIAKSYQNFRKGVQELGRRAGPEAYLSWSVSAARGA
jgi:TRAP-type mannitol/chloroaromatic compound transport system substrate-binding protein